MKHFSIRTKRLRIEVFNPHDDSFSLEIYFIDFDPDLACNECVDLGGGFKVHKSFLIDNPLIIISNNLDYILSDKSYEDTLVKYNLSYTALDDIISEAVENVKEALKWRDIIWP